MSDLPEDELARAEKLCAGINWESSSSSLDALVLAMRAERAQCAAFLLQMAIDSIRHGYVDASSYHAAYRQGVEEAAAALLHNHYIAATPNQTGEVDRT